MNFEIYLSCDLLRMKNKDIYGSAIGIIVLCQFQYHIKIFHFSDFFKTRIKFKARGCYYL